MVGEQSAGEDGSAETEGRYGQCLVALFLLGVVLFHPLVLDVFDSSVMLPGRAHERPAMLLGMPLLYLYVFFAWGLLIALLALVVERASRQPGPQAGAPSEGEIE